MNTTRPTLPGGPFRDQGNQRPEAVFIQDSLRFQGESVTDVTGNRPDLRAARHVGFSFSQLAGMAWNRIRNTFSSNRPVRIAVDNREPLLQDLPLNEVEEREVEGNDDFYDPRTLRDDAKNSVKMIEELIAVLNEALPENYRGIESHYAMEEAKALAEKITTCLTHLDSTFVGNGRSHEERRGNQDAAAKALYRVVNDAVFVISDLESMVPLHPTTAYISSIPVVPTSPIPNAASTSSTDIPTAYPQR